MGSRRDRREYTSHYVDEIYRTSRKQYGYKYGITRGLHEYELVTTDISTHFYELRHEFPVREEHEDRVTWREKGNSLVELCS